MKAQKSLLGNSIAKLLDSFTPSGRFDLGTGEFFIFLEGILSKSIIGLPSHFDKNSHSKRISHYSNNTRVTSVTYFPYLKKGLPDLAILFLFFFFYLSRIMVSWMRFFATSTLITFTSTTSPTLTTSNGCFTNFLFVS